VVKPLAGSPLWCRYVLAWRPDAVTDGLVETLVGSATDAYRDLVAQAPHLRTWASRTWSAAGT
jgi:hypothetical protein